jgi:diguanylate cyclase (GGDEF)-like protein/PAS domain S-box-containing protein
MQRPPIFSQLFKDISLPELMRFRPCQITFLLILLLWLLNPAIDALINQERGYFYELTHLTPLETLFLLAASLFIFITGMACSLAFLHIERQQRALLDQRQKLSQIIQYAPDCVKTVSRDGVLLDMNPAGLAIIEADHIDQVRGHSVYELIVPEHRQRYIDFNKRIFDGHSEIIEYDIIGLKGTRKSVESHAVPLRDSHGQIITHLATARDITQSRQLAEKLSFQASHDMLTGLINRHEFERRLENILSQTDNPQETHAVFFIDLDQFKLVNDTCGHMVGDQLLIQLSSIMREQVRQYDYVARLGGDEFAILLQYCSPDDARMIADKLRLAIDEFNFAWEERQFKVTASIGVVSIDHTNTSVADILREADTCCYLAKEKGRNRIQVHQKGDKSAAKHQGEMHWISRIHAGIANQRFILFGQEIVSLDSNRNESHLELLIRYRSEDGSLTPPGAFLPAAERYGISPKLDRYVIENAFRQLTANTNLLNRYDSFCINLSGLSLGEEEILNCIIRNIKANPALGNKLCFEVTETAAISNMQEARYFISQLQAFGCRFALDDFGSGLSSFGYLKSLPVDYVKIDGDFVRDILDDPIDLAMVKSINDIGHLMGKQTIAEFVENDAIREQLQLIGVDFAQGYGIARPRRLDELIQNAA